MEILLLTIVIAISAIPIVNIISVIILFRKNSILKKKIETLESAEQKANNYLSLFDNIKSLNKKIQTLESKISTLEPEKMG